MSSQEEQSTYKDKEPLSLVERLQSGLAALFVTPSPQKNDGDGNQFQESLSPYRKAKVLVNNVAEQ
jgi:hypothetical protein